MFRNFEAQTANEVWCQAAAAFQESDALSAQASRCGETREMLHATICINDPLQRWVSSRRPALNPAFALAEVVWLVRGREDAAFLNYFNSRLPKYAGCGSSYHGAYGFRLRRRLGLDQLERAYDVFRHEPNSRQVVLQLWDGRIDLPKPDGTPQDPDVPCNVLAMLKVRNDKLEWTQVMRSSDLFLGLPHNFVQFTTLQEVLAGWLNLQPGTYHQLCDSLHVYRRDLEYLGMSEKLEPHLNSDHLALSKEASDHWFAELERRADRIVNPEVPPDELMGLLDWSEAPTAYRNMLTVMVAEGQRRRGSQTLAEEAIRTCTNKLFRLLWEQWTERISNSGRRSSSMNNIL